MLETHIAISLTRELASEMVNFMVKELSLGPHISLLSESGMRRGF